jgi:hypothetical protein
VSDGDEQGTIFWNPRDEISHRPGFPPDLLRQSARRLQVLALLYAVVFFMAGMLPALMRPADREIFLGNVLQWGPGVIGISVAIFVAAIIQFTSIKPLAALNLGLVFEVASSFAIAAAEFADPMQIELRHEFLGLSWVAVWVVLFTIVVPTTPRQALVAALTSVSSLPVIIALVLASGATTTRLDQQQFFFGLVFPYLLVVAMAYVGARIVYGLGSEVTKARELGGYRLEEKLGEGSMGEVWRATHRMLARPSAIKMIRPSLAGGPGTASVQAREMFEREAKAIATLRSPHTVHLFDYGISDFGAFYYAMELLDGHDTDWVVKCHGPLPPERTIHVLRQLCHSLSEAQSAGLVHRDIKPANIFLCRYGEEFDFVKVLDFGVVHAIRGVADTGLLEVDGGHIRGTPAVMSPEQARGSGVDGRADIYSTGCLAYFLLTGHHVFAGDDTISILVQHASATPVRPSERSSQPIPPELDQLVMACLEKEPADRPQTARELARRLNEIPGASGWTQERAAMWWSGR